MLSVSTLSLSMFLNIPGPAYLGPGLGGGAIAAVLGVILSILLAVFAIVWYPIKRLLRRFRRKRPDAPKKERDEA